MWTISFYVWILIQVDQYNLQKINKNLTFGIIASIKSIKDGWKNNHYEWFEKYTDACTTADIFIFGVAFKLIHIPNQLPSLHQNTQQWNAPIKSSWCKFHCGL